MGMCPKATGLRVPMRFDRFGCERADRPWRPHAKPLGRRPALVAEVGKFYLGVTTEYGFGMLMVIRSTTGRAHPVTSIASPFLHAEASR